jgi:hypothetical protein
MSKILFIENRVNIYPYGEISKNLIKKNIQVNWLIQNNFFVPSYGKIYKIKYPPKKYLSKKNKFKKISKMDRAVKYFYSDTRHYEYYYNEIKKILLKVKPDLVVGESTLIHELLTIDLCKKLKIRYLFMQSARIFVNRLCFYDSDYLKYSFGERKKLSNRKLNNIIKNIKSNKNLLYNKTISNQSTNLFKNLYFWIKIFYSRTIGEKYNTPNLFIKAYLFFILKINKIKWKIHSLNKNTSIFNNKKFKILYTMQLQPEMNIDVWGFPHNDQYKIISSLIKISKKIDGLVFVKSNPKIKYELNSKIIELKKKNKNIFFLDNNFRLSGNLSKFDLIFNITGSILLEATINKIPAATFTRSNLFKTTGIKLIKKYEDLIKIINQVKNKKYLFSNDNEIKKLINFHYSSSYSIERLNYNYSNLKFAKKNILKISNLISNILKFQK